MIEKEVDVLIVGGGLTGGALMLALKSSGLKVLLVDAKPLSNALSDDFDARSLALSPASVRILKMLGVWPHLEVDATAIETIHVSEQCRFGAVRLQGTKKEPLGFVIELQRVQRALRRLIEPSVWMTPWQFVGLDKKNKIATLSNKHQELKVKAALIVAADGTLSPMRNHCGLTANIKDYQQVALTANIGLARPHKQHAYERFASQGPLALLPMSEHRTSLVWSLSKESAAEMMMMDEKMFIRSLHAAFGYRLGRFLKVGQRAMYPLHQVVMPSQVAWPVVFVGNAAHTLHPIAGQGFNLGLRDVALLAQCLIEKGISPTALDEYQRLRSHDQRAIIHLTDGLVTVFNAQFPGAQCARNIGLLALEHVPILKKCLTHYASGFGGMSPDLVCQIPLGKKT